MLGWHQLATGINMNCEEVKDNLPPHTSARSYKINLPTTTIKKTKFPDTL